MSLVSTLTATYIQPSHIISRAQRRKPYLSREKLPLSHAHLCCVAHSDMSSDHEQPGNVLRGGEHAHAPLHVEDGQLCKVYPQWQLL